MSLPVYYRLVVMKEQFIVDKGYQPVVIGNHCYMLEGDIDFEYFDDVLWHLMLDHGYMISLKEIDEPKPCEEVNAFTARGRSYTFSYFKEEREDGFIYDSRA